MTLYVLECEDINKRPLFEFHKELLIGNLNVLIPLWTMKDKYKKKRYKVVIRKYFLNLGIREITFLDERDRYCKEKFEKVDIVYLPGGNPKIFLENMMKNAKIISMLRNFNRIIIWNSV